MAVSGISSAGNVGIKPVTAKSTNQTASNPPASGSTPAATVNISHQATVAAASLPAATSSPTATSTTPPKVNTVKVAIKEGNEPIQLLTKQAKHGDQVAKLLLKQINLKQAAKQSESTETEDVSESEESSPEEEKSGVGETSENTESPEASQGSESAGPAEAGKGELVDQHA